MSDSLREDERRSLGCQCWRLNGVWHHIPDCRVPAVERILAARAQPEGTERVEWNRLDETGEPTVSEGGWRGYNAKNYGRQMVAEHGGTLVRRTVTEFAPIVGEWEPVDG